ncbi:MAG TPA: hypothetical protein VH208_09140, partial [Myxococcaceae bacterium]|nr:hypothetical protein [Myxococcaceae bacterium]
MPSSQNPGDPLSDLRSSLDEDEPFFPGPKPAGTAPATPPPVQGAPSAGPPPVPPPLPRRPSGKSGIFPPAGRPSAVMPAQQSPAAKSGPFPAATPCGPVQPPVPVTPSGGARITGDPFKEPPEPRPPRSGSPEEKLEYFRAVLKSKEETLARGRQLFAERDAEAEKLRGMAGALKGQLDDALKQLEEARAELSSNEEDRKDLSRALAETEAQVPMLKEQLEQSKAGHAALSAELAGAKEAVALAQERVSELGARNSELGGDLEAIQEQYQQVTAENQKLMPELEGVKEELATVTAERNAAVADRDVTKEDLESATAKLGELESQLQLGSEKLKTLESESEWTKNSLEQSERQVRSVAEAKAQLEAKLAQREAEAGARSSEIAKQLENEQARSLGLEGERNEIADELKQTKSDFDSYRQQSKAQLEAEKKKVHESLTASFTKKLTDADARLSAEKEQREELESQLHEATGRSKQLEKHSAQVERDFQDKLSSAESAGAKKLRDELNQANKKAMEAN